MFVPCQINVTLFMECVVGKASSIDPHSVSACMHGRWHVQCHSRTVQDDVAAVLLQRSTV